MKKRISVSLVYLLFFLIVLGTVSTSVYAASLKLNKKKISISVGSKYRLKATVKGSRKKVKWSSSNKSVATVTSKGLIKGKKAGKATITVKCGKLKKKCKVTVKQADSKAIAAYKKTLKSLSWPTAVFAVVDINGDGSYEVIVEDIVYNGNKFHPERKGKILCWHNGALKCYNYGPGIETFEAINSNRQIYMGRTRGKAITTIYSFSPGAGIKEVTSYFGAYLKEDEIVRLNKKYMSGLKHPVFVRISSQNLKKYLSGKGKPTGTSSTFVSKGHRNYS